MKHTLLRYDSPQEKDSMENKRKWIYKHSFGKLIKQNYTKRTPPCCASK